MEAIEKIGNFFALLGGFFEFLLYAIGSIFSLLWRLILKLFSLSEWTSFFNFIDDLSLYLGSYTIVILSGLFFLMLMRFFKFIIGLFKGSRVYKKGV